MYYIYHIPGKKIGVTRNLYKRVTLTQGYNEDEYEILDSSNDVKYISEREVSLQKHYGYKVDRQLYCNLIKNKLESIQSNYFLGLITRCKDEYFIDEFCNYYFNL